MSGRSESGPDGGRSDGLGRVLLVLAVLAICAVVLFRGLETTRGLHWPFDEDLFRDIAQARTMADGAWLADPFYRGESIWYNPLAPALVAAATTLANLPANEASVRLGPWVGLAAPLAFLALAATLVGRPGGVVALLFFVFVTPGRLPGLQCATYSPWPFAAQVAQGPFYLGLLALAWAGGRPVPGRFLVVGVLLGVTFLAHTGPALLLGAVAATLVFLGPGTWPHRTGRLALVFGTALVVASPFLWSIVGRYHLRVVNSDPGTYVWTGAAAASPAMILATIGARPGLFSLALLGAVAAMRRTSRTPFAAAARPLVGAWAFWGAFFLAYSLSLPALRARGAPLPPLVPAFHFAMLLSALVSLCAGFGLAWLGARLAAVVKARPDSATTGAAVVALGLAPALLSYPTWWKRGDFVEARRLAEFQGGWADRVATHRWVRAHTSVDDVFLAEDDPGLHVVATAGRKLVVVDSGFSNPFVAWKPRADAATRMLGSLHPGGHDVFHPLAVEYHVSYVLVSRRRGRPFPDAPFLVRVFQRGDLAIYRTGCWTK